MRPDWYQATIEDTPQNVMGFVSKLGSEVRPADQMARMYRYEQGYAVLNQTRGVVAHVFTGGNGGKVHAFATSDAADNFMSLCRNEWPERHLVTRVDPAQDFNEAGAYDRVRRVAYRVAKARKMRFPQHLDPLNPTAGRTQYIGSPTSDYRARLYDKGLEVIGKQERKLQDSAGMIVNTITGELVRPEDWVRLELQARPKGEEARRIAASATMEQIWTFTEWSAELARDALALDLERAYIRTRKQSKDEESLRWMCQQYGALLLRRQSHLGTWSEVGEELSRIIRAQVER